MNQIFPALMDYIRPLLQLKNPTAMPHSPSVAIKSVPDDFHMVNGRMDNAHKDNGRVDNTHKDNTYKDDFHNVNGRKDNTHKDSTHNENAHKENVYEDISLKNNEGDATKKSRETIGVLSKIFILPPQVMPPKAGVTSKAPPVQPQAEVTPTLLSQPVSHAPTSKFQRLTPQVMPPRAVVISKTPTFPPKAEVTPTLLPQLVPHAPTSKFTRFIPQMMPPRDAAISKASVFQPTATVISKTLHKPILPQQTVLPQFVSHELVALQDSIAEQVSILNGDTLMHIAASISKIPCTVSPSKKLLRPTSRPA